MVLHGQLCGRVGRCRVNSRKAPVLTHWGFALCRARAEWSAKARAALRGAFEHAGRLVPNFAGDCGRPRGAAVSGSLVGVASSSRPATCRSARPSSVAVVDRAGLRSFNELLQSPRALRALVAGGGRAELARDWAAGGARGWCGAGSKAKPGRAASWRKWRAVSLGLGQVWLRGCARHVSGR